jgi:hypothetical protein
VKKVEDPRSFGVVKTTPEGVITEFVEKSPVFVSDLAIVGTPQGVTLPTRFEATPLVRYPFEVECLESHPFAQI